MKEDPHWPESHSENPGSRLVVESAAGSSAKASFWLKALQNSPLE